MELKDFKKLIAPYLPALLFEERIPVLNLFRLRRLLSGIAAALIVVIVFWRGGAGAEAFFKGLFLIVFGGDLILFSLSFFYLSASASMSASENVEQGRSISLDFARVLYHALKEVPDNQATPFALGLSFLNTEPGKFIVERLGLKDAVPVFLSQNHEPNQKLMYWSTSPQNIKEYLQLIIKVSPVFYNLFLANQVNEQQILSTLDWYERITAVSDVRPWQRESLAKISGIGKDWTYGSTYYLNKYGRQLVPLVVLRPISEVEMVESVLAGQVSVSSGLSARSSSHAAGNVLLVGSHADGLFDVVVELARRIDDGTISVPLAHKRLIVLNQGALLGEGTDKAAFEHRLQLVFFEASYAGNIILVFDNFASLYKAAHDLGTDLMALIDPFLQSGQVQTIAVTDERPFHQLLEINPAVMQGFEKIVVKTTSVQSLLTFVEDKALLFEGQVNAKGRRLLFTYPALEALVESAQKYFSQNAPLDKVQDLFVELAGAMLNHPRSGGYVLKADVLDLVEKKTGVPVKTATREERHKLLDLEKVLRQRVIGQDQAVSAVANALRRSREGLSKQSKPMGSFLFLGPTGVGKTETAKALSQAYFGSEKNMIRFDMSEYNGPDGLYKMIGSFDSGTRGDLPERLNDQQFGVLLLDEFEKSSRQVQDIFLQILDEGFFTDASGMKVNAENLIIIATSNAGSELIWRALENNQKISDIRQSIIDKVIADGTLRPELLNRFDEVIIFKPLSADQLRAVADLALSELRTELLAKGIEFTVTDEVLDALSKEGQARQFGGRAIRRAVEDKVANSMAKKLLEGQIKAGQKYVFSMNDWQK